MTEHISNTDALYIKGYTDGMKDSDLDNVIPNREPKEIKLDNMEKIVLILIGTGAQTHYEGSKSKNSKKNQMKDAGYSLEDKKLVKTDYTYGGYDAELTDAGKDYFDSLSSSDISSVVRTSAAQQERQAERVNGQYSEMNTCDYCCKRSANVSIDDENDGVFICPKCSAKRDAGQKLTMGNC